MNILFLTQLLPYPPDTGPKVKTWHVLRYITELGHKVTLASFTRPDEERYVSVLREICAAVHTVPIQRSRMKDLRYWLRSHLTGRPFLVERDDLEEMRDLVERLLANEPIHAIHADQLTMAQFALPPDPPAARVNGRASLLFGSNGAREVRSWPYLVFDAHNAVWTILERMAENSHPFLKPITALEAQRTKRYEGMVVQNFDLTLAVTELDRKALEQAAAAFASNTIPARPPRIAVIPIAVDTQTLQPVKRQAGSCRLVTLGTLHYLPNVEGIRWFLREVFPLVRQEVPGAALTIIGKNPPADFLQAAAEQPQTFEVTGYVPDLTPYLEKSALMVVAVRNGGGMRVRILEAFARAMPTVTTTVGLEGIEAEPGKEVLVADTPAELSQAIIRLLRDPDLQDRLAEHGRSVAARRYDWQAVLKNLGEIYQEIELENTGESSR